MLKINYPEQEQKNYEEYSISPSGLTDCSRQLFYKYTNVPVTDPIDKLSLAKMEMGTVLHDWFVGLMEDVTETEVLHELDAFGFRWRYKIDAITTEDGVKVINEVKTVPDYSYKIAKDGLDHESHVRQLQVYMVLEYCSNGRLIYLNRNTGEWMAYDFVMQEDNGAYLFTMTKHLHANGTPTVQHKDKMPLDMLIDKHKKIEEQISLQQIPEREYQMYGKMVNGEFKPQYSLNGVFYRSNWQCTYCRWKTLCWKLKEFKESGDIFLEDFMNKQ